jgi:hypothetical protein
MASVPASSGSICSTCPLKARSSGRMSRELIEDRFQADLFIVALEVLPAFEKSFG